MCHSDNSQRNPPPNTHVLSLMIAKGELHKSWGESCITCDQLSSCGADHDERIAVFNKTPACITLCNVDVRVKCKSHQNPCMQPVHTHRPVVTHSWYYASVPHDSDAPRPPTSSLTLMCMMRQKILLETNGPESGARGVDQHSPGSTVSCALPPLYFEFDLHT
jgi:hypothetical protein